MDTWSVPLQTHWTDNKGLLETDGSVVLNLNPLRNYGTRKSVQKYNIISKCTGLFSILFLSQLPIRTHYLRDPGKVSGVSSGYFHVLGVCLALSFFVTPSSFTVLTPRAVSIRISPVAWLTALSEFEIGCPSIYTLGSSGRENRTRRALLF